MSDTAIAVTISAVFLAAYAALVVTAIVQVVCSKVISYPAAVVWVVAIVVFPLVGSLAWFFIGNKTTQIENSVRTAVR